MIKSYKSPQLYITLLLLFLTEKLFSLNENNESIFYCFWLFKRPHQTQNTTEHERNNNLNILLNKWTFICATNSHHRTRNRKFFIHFPFSFISLFLQRARQSTCIDPLSGKRIPFLEIFPEDLLCHASALSSLGLTLKFKYLVLHVGALAIFIWQTFFMHF
jgi:hypothetical protein